MRKIVYIIEDSRVVSYLMKNNIEKLGNIKVLEFTDVEMAKYSFDEYPPDILIIDYFLDATNKLASNGEKLLKNIVKENSGVKSIVISGVIDPEKGLELIDMGADYFISKNSRDFIDELNSGVMTLLND